MRAKIVLLARFKRTDPAKKTPYDLKPVEIRRGQPIPPKATTDWEPTGSYYIRYSENGKRHVKPVGANINQAFVAYRNRELALARSRNGLLPITDTEPTPEKVRIADAV